MKRRAPPLDMTPEFPDASSEEYIDDLAAVIREDDRNIKRPRRDTHEQSPQFHEILNQLIPKEDEPLTDIVADADMHATLGPPLQLEDGITVKDLFENDSGIVGVGDDAIPTEPQDVGIANHELEDEDCPSDEIISLDDVEPLEESDESKTTSREHSPESDADDLDVNPALEAIAKHAVSNYFDPKPPIETLNVALQPGLNELFNYELGWALKGNDTSPNAQKVDIPNAVLQLLFEHIETQLVNPLFGRISELFKSPENVGFHHVSKIGKELGLPLALVQDVKLMRYQAPPFSTSEFADVQSTEITAFQNIFGSVKFTKIDSAANL